MSGMKFSRRAFLEGTTAIALAQAIPDRAKAWPVHGIVTSAPSGTPQTVINAGGSSLAFLNAANGIGISTSGAQANFPSLLSANGYPSGTLTNGLSGNNIILDNTYYGQYYHWWVGTGSFVYTGQPAIVYSGGTSCAGVSPSSSGSVGSNFTLGVFSSTQPTSSSPVVFAFGALISAVTTSGDGLIQFTTSISIAFGSGFPTGTKFKFNNLTYNGGAFPTGPNSDGSWTITNVSGTQFKLQGSSSLTAGLVSLNTSGTPGINSEAISQVGSASWSFLNSATYSGFGGMVICKSGDVAAINAGHYVSPNYVTQMKLLNPRFIRFMDFSSVQGDRSSSYTYRNNASNLNWTGTNFVSAYYTPSSSITNTGASGGFSDVYTCNSPSASGSGAYANGEIVIGQLGSSATNAGYTPGLNVGGRGIAPILNSSGELLNVTMSGTVPTVGSVQTLVFTGGGLASPHTLNYTTVSGDNSFANLWVHLQTAITNDATLSALGIQTINTGFSSGFTTNAQAAIFFNPNINSSGAADLNNGMTVTGSDASSNATYNFGTYPKSNLGNNAYFAFTYNKLAGGWIAKGGYGLNGGAPFEFQIDLCNQVGCGLYWNVPTLWDTTSIASAVTQFANANVKELVIELSNETWNGNLQEFGLYVWQGACLGLPFSSNRAVHGFYGLRVLQIAAAASAAWIAAGRSRSQLFITNAYQFVDMNAVGGGNTVPYRFNSSDLNASGTGTNVALKAFGGPGVTSITTNYSVAPNRSIDSCDIMSPAPYANGTQLSSGNGNEFLRSQSTLSSVSDLFLAAYNYVYGNSSQQAAALEFLYSSTTGHGDLYDGWDSYAGAPSASPLFNADFLLYDWTAAGTNPGFFGAGNVAGSYDASRSSAGTGAGAQAKLGVVCYEGGWVFGPVTPGEASSLASGSAPGGSTNLVNLGYTNGYASSLAGAASGGPTGSNDTAANIAACIAVLLVGNINQSFTLTGTPNVNLTGFEGDARGKAWTTLYLNAAVTAFTNSGSRMAIPAWYGFDGPSDFSLYFGTVNSSPAPTQAVAAISAFN